MGDIRAQIEQCHRISDSDVSANGGDHLQKEERVSVIHYTSVGTVVSMLQDILAERRSSLRLYDTYHSNDPGEGTRLARCLDLPKKYGWPDKEEESHAYVASFILETDNKGLHDNLVFWRTYGREGEGCSLKFRVPRNQLRKVLYDEGAKRTASILLPVVKALHPLASNRMDANYDLAPIQDIQDDLSVDFWRHLEGVRYLYKDEAYAYECESRFVVPERFVSDKDKISFAYREQGDSCAHVRHYCEKEYLKTTKILISGSLITLGPRVPYAQSMRYYLENLLRKADLLPGPQVTVSRIPYRVP